MLTLGRGRPPVADLQHLPFDLADARLPALPASLDAFIHLACDTTGLNAERLDLPTARLLAKAFEGRPTRLVFASSQTASETAPTPYGRAKAAVEEILRPAGAVIIRPGLVYGGAPAGVWGMMRALVARLPVLPALLPPAKVQPIHLDDLCHAFLAAAEGAGRPGQTLAVAAVDPVTITDFLKAIARSDGRWRFFAPAPTKVLLWAASCGGAVVPALRPLARQLLSLTHLPQMASAADLKTLGIEPRALIAGMRGRTGRRRDRLVEGVSLLEHVLSARPPSSALRRYVRATETLGLTPSPGLGGARLRFYAPTLAERDLAGLGLPQDLPLRLRLALAIADSSPSTAPAFYRLKSRAAPIGFLGLAATVAGEAPFLLLRELRGRMGASR